LAPFHRLLCADSPQNSSTAEMPKLEALIPRNSMGNSGQNHNMKIGNISQEKGATFKYKGWNFISGNYLFTIDTK